MKFATLAAFVFTALSGVSAMPAVKRDVGPDQPTLNWALNLDMIEEGLYKDGLDKFDEKAFSDAGFPAGARGRIEQMYKHETQHHFFIAEKLGPTAPTICTYKFPYTNVKEFIEFAAIVESVRVSAYSGANKLLVSKDLLTAASLVMAVEARHASYLAGALSKENPWSGPRDTVLTQRQAWTLGLSWIETCPSSNPDIPIPTFAQLTIGSGKPGDFVGVNYNATTAVADGTQMYVAFINGIDQTIVPINGGKVQLPITLIGYNYAIVTTNGTQATDDTTVAGPTIVQFHFDSTGQITSQN